MCTNNKGILSLLKWFWGSILVGLILAFLLFYLIAKGFLGVMPSFEELENPKNSLATEVISEDQKVLGNFAIENRTFVDYADLSPYIVNALVPQRTCAFTITQA